MAPRPALLASLCAAIVACGTNVDLGGTPEGAEAGARVDGLAPTCAGYAAPQQNAKCTACSYACQANGCYDGWYCRLASRDCVSPRRACSAEPHEGGHE